MTKIKEYLNLILGLFLVATSFNLFLSPYNFAAGGISGTSLIVHKLFGWNESVFILISNILLLIISEIFLGTNTTKKTIVGSLLFPVFVSLTSKLSLLIKIENIELIVIAIIGGLFSGIGYGLIFKSGFTSGGTDIINQLMEKYLHMPISKSIILVDGFITVLSGFTFGLSNMIYALIALFLISIYSNKQIIGIDSSKIIYISSKKYQEIKEYLHKELKIDSTDFDAIGGYKKKKIKIILSVIDSKNYYRVKEAIAEIDPKAFVVATSSYHLVNANKKIRELY